MLKKEWTSHLEFISKEISGKLKIIHRPSFGASVEYFPAQLSFGYKGNDIIIEQLFTQRDYENFEVGSIYLTYEFENRFDFYLYLYERAFLDKLFNRKRIKTGFATFDNMFSLKSNDEKLARKIFSNMDLLNQFLSNRSLIINISSKNRLTIIKMKDLEAKLYSKTEYLGLLKNIKFIIDSIIE